MILFTVTIKAEFPSGAARSRRSRASRVSEEQARYLDMSEDSLDLTCAHDLNGTLLDVNPAAARVLGYETDELINRNLRELIRSSDIRRLDEYVASVAQTGSAAGLVTLRTRSGELRTWKYACTLQTAGVPGPFVRGVAHDVTDILQAQQALRDSEERLRVAAEVGRMYAWEWDPRTDSVRRSAECADILGLTGVTTEGFAKDYFNFVNPDDRERLWKLVRALTPADPVYRTQYRRSRPDGTQLWLEESGRATFNEAGKMTRLVGMTADITGRKEAEHKLLASDERSRRLVEESPVAMLVSHGPGQKVEVVNDRFTALFGYTLEDMPDVAAWWPLAYPNPVYRAAIAREWQARVTEAMKNRSVIAPMEGKVRCKDGSERYIEFHFASLGETHLVSFVDLTDRKQAEEALAKVGGKLIEAQDKERTRIARDLHDDICQRLALLGIELEQLRAMSDKSRPSVREQIKKIQNHLSEILLGVSTISHELHSSTLDLLGLSVALRSLCEELSRTHKLKIEFIEQHVPRNLPRDISVCLFRVAQEALRNCLKHSRAGLFQVQLSGRRGEVRLSIRDSGVGFDPTIVKDQPGMGLINMRERIALVRGTIAINSSPRGGTEVLCSVPVESRA